ncbi:MAG: insulinase family protein [Bacteroidales bacterium]|nr:insulinase family protein [Bacteroidales bacterium]
MIDFERFTLENGLKVIVHQDKTTPIAAINILYNVGSRDEDPEKTGFAHLFEHLMFGGSVNIPKYDTPLENAGGENNAFTNNDITSFYLTIPASNIELAFWLESDRMLGLAFNKKSLQVQKNVVTEEFRQVYLNQPYGDAWLLLRPMAYQVHPYRWNTIGKDISHIEKATMEDVILFYNRFYNPNNAILTVAGDFHPAEIKQLAERWFGHIPAGKKIYRELPTEPEQNEHRELSIHRDVPLDTLYKAYHMCNRMATDYYATDLLSDILSNGDSSRLYQNLVKGKRVFSEINAYITGDMDEGLFVITGKPVAGIDLKIAESALQEEIYKITSEPVNDKELQKVKNKIESSFEFSQMNVLNKAMNLAFFEHLGDAGWLNLEVGKYNSVTAQKIIEVACSILRQSNCSTLYYKSN